MFDDRARGLREEPLLLGTDLILDKLTEAIEDAYGGFRLLFSATPFPDYQLKLRWTRAEFGGNWYKDGKHKLDGWLCPALCLYFPEAPRELYVSAGPARRTAPKRG